MCGFDRFPTWALGDAKHRSGVSVEPVREVAHAVLPLDRQVFQMIRRDFLRRRAGRVMTVDEDRHAQRRPPSPDLTVPRVARRSRLPFTNLTHREVTEC